MLGSIMPGDGVGRGLVDWLVGSLVGNYLRVERWVYGANEVRGASFIHWDWDIVNREGDLETLYCPVWGEYDGIGCTGECMLRQGKSSRSTLLPYKFCVRHDIQFDQNPSTQPHALHNPPTPPIPSHPDPPTQTTLQTSDTTIPLPASTNTHTVSTPTSASRIALGKISGRLTSPLLTSRVPNPSGRDNPTQHPMRLTGTHTSSQRRCGIVLCPALKFVERPMSRNRTPMARGTRRIAMMPMKCMRPLRVSRRWDGP